VPPPERERPPSPEREGLAWGDGELRAFLRARGLGTVFVTECESPDLAVRYIAATRRQKVPFPNGPTAFAWGRFVLSGEPAAAAGAAKALGVPAPAPGP
jgi:hypothetical protein